MDKRMRHFWCHFCGWEGDKWQTTKNCPRCKKRLQLVPKEKLEGETKRKKCFVAGCEKDATLICTYGCGEAYCTDHLQNTGINTGLCVNCQKPIIRWPVQLIKHLTSTKEKDENS